MVDAADHRSLAIYICDRGYASYNNFANVIENGQYFLIRCTDKKTEGILGFSLEGIKEMDFHADRILTRSQSKKKRAHPERAQDYRHVCSAVPMDYLTDDRPEYAISLRVICAEITSNVKIEEHGRKYGYQADYSEAIRTCRDFLRIHDGKSTMDAEGLIASNIEAVRPGRTFPRQKRFKIPMSFCYRI